MRMILPILFLVVFQYFVQTGIAQAHTGRLKVNNQIGFSVKMVGDTLEGIFVGLEEESVKRALSSAGYTFDSNCKFAEGHFFYYYEDGWLQRECRYSGMKRNGPWKDYFTLGRLKKSRTYVSGELEGTATCYDSITGNSYYEEVYRDGKLNGISKQFLPNSGKLLKSWTYKYGKLNGPFCKYDSITGSMLIEGNYINDMRNGRWHYYPWDGNTDMPLAPFLHIYITYVDGDLDGPVEYFSPDSTRIGEGNYLRGRKSGLWKFKKYSHGTWDNEQGSYENGLKSGVWTKFFDWTGGVESLTTYSSGRKEGAYVEYDENHNKLKEGAYFDDKRCGFWNYYLKGTDFVSSTAEYGENGSSVFQALYDDRLHKLMALGSSVEGEKVGEWIVYYPGGKDTEMIKTFRDDVLHGYICFFDSVTHHRIVEGEYVDGRRSGNWYYWWPKKPDTLAVRMYHTNSSCYFREFDSVSHELIQVGKAENGHDDSIVLRYFKGNHRIKHMDSYLNAVRNGACVAFDSLSGDTLRTGYYVDGKYAGEWRFYFAGTRQLQAKISYRNSQKHGPSISYYSSGNKRDVGDFVDGQRTGEWKFYDPMTGELVEKAEYKDGNKNGNDIFFFGGREDHRVIYQNGVKIE